MAPFFAALPAFITALPQMMTLAAQFMGLVGKFVSWAEKNQVHLWMEKVENQIDQLEKANTPDEKHAAARGLSDIIKSLG